LVVTVVAGLTFGGYIGGCADCNQKIQCENKSLVTFTFDDGYLSQFEKAYPILQDYGYTGVVYIVTDNVNTNGYMNDEHVRILKYNGWEIGSHTSSHPDLITLTDDELTYELEQSYNYISNEFGHSKQIGFASPFGSYNNQMIPDISNYYIYHRTCNNGYNNIPPDDIYQLNAMVVYSNTPVDEVKSWIDYAHTNHKWLILVFHRFDEGGQYSWSSIDFDTIVKYVADFDYENYR
jgi:peptidoglycan/xylan/chitin deacetylase (PgdA/CDA1 family)